MHLLRSVGAKLLILFFVSTFLSVLLVGMISYGKSQTIIEGKMKALSQTTVREAGEKIGLMLKQFEDMSLQFSTSRELQQQLAAVFDETADPADGMKAKMSIQDALNQIARTNSHIKAISLFDSADENKTISSVSAGLIRIDRDSAWYGKVTGMKGTALWLPMAKDGYTGLAKGNLFGLSRMIGGYLIVFEIDAALLSQTLETIRFSESSGMMLTGEDGKVMLSLQSAETGQTLDPAAASSDLLIVSEPLKKTGWTLTGIVPLRELVSETKSIRNVTLLVCAAAAVVAVAIGYLMLLHIGKPLLRMRNLLNEAADGNLDARLGLRRNDEIGEVAASFDTMMERMKRLIEQTRQSADRVLDTASGLLLVSRGTAAASGEISAATEEITQGSAQLAAEADQSRRLVSSMQEDLTAVVDATNEIGRASAEVKDACSEGNAFMSNIVRSTMESEASIDRLVKRISNLETNTGEMRNIVDLMNRMAQNTKILSLNAGIEASQSAQASGGFKVIAGEMGRLSDQSRLSLAQVGEMAETIREEVGQAVEALKLALPLLQYQIGSIKTADGLFAKVHEKSEAFIERAERIKQNIELLERKQGELNGSISNVGSFSRQASATSEQVAALSAGQLESSREVVDVAKELESLSSALQSTLSGFRKV